MSLFGNHPDKRVSHDETVTVLHWVKRGKTLAFGGRFVLLVAASLTMTRLDAMRNEITVYTAETRSYFS